MMKAGQSLKPGKPTRPAEKPGLTVYMSKKYSFGNIHIVRARNGHGMKVISVSIRSKGANGVTKTHQSLTLTPLRWREILPILAEELENEERLRNQLHSPSQGRV